MRNTARLFVVQLGFVALIEPLVSALTIAELVLGYLCDGSAPRRARTSHVDSFQGLLDLNLRVGRAAHGDAACDLRPPPDTLRSALQRNIARALQRYFADERGQGQNPEEATGVKGQIPQKCEKTAGRGGSPLMQAHQGAS